MNDLKRPSRVEIDLDALKFNIKNIKSMMPAESRLMAVVKADAYGHGAVKVAQTAEECGVDYLGVAFLEEANELGDSGIEVPITILYPETPERSLEAVRRGFHISVSSLDEINRIKEMAGDRAESLKYFVSLNTGMNRYGLDPDSASINRIIASKVIGNGLVGFNTNIADPLMSRENLAKRQEDRFIKFMQDITRSCDNGVLFSYEASGSIWHNKEVTGNLARVGLLLYGIAPDKMDRINLKPVMSVKSRIAEIHKLSSGEGVGYGFSFIAKRDSQVAVVPVGYADGYPWQASNKGSVIVNERFAPILGRICMDAFMIDITDIENVQVGDEVVLMGRQGIYKIDANQLADWAGSLSYEILAGWGKRMPREYL